jgi:hypothetical protein
MNRTSEVGLRLPIVEKLLASAKEAGLPIEPLANLIFPEEDRTKRENDLLRKSFFPYAYQLLNDEELDRLRVYTGKPLPRPVEPTPAPAAVSPAPPSPPPPMAFTAPTSEEPRIQLPPNLGPRAAWEALQVENRRRNAAYRHLDEMKAALSIEADANGDVNLRDGWKIVTLESRYLVVIATSRWYPPDGSPVVNVGCAVDELDIEKHSEVLKERGAAATRSRSYDWPAHLPPPNPDFWVRAVFFEEGQVMRTWQNAHGENKPMRWQRWFVFYNGTLVEVTEDEHRTAWILRKADLNKRFPPTPANGPPPPSFDT